jgi:hypothetical protein
MPITSWRDQRANTTLGDRADYLWHVRESERLVSLGLAAPHLMTFEDQQVWAVICESGHFWRGWTAQDGDEEVWRYECKDETVLRDRVETLWDQIVAVANGEAAPESLPSDMDSQKHLTAPERAAVASGPSGGLDDEIPF